MHYSVQNVYLPDIFSKVIGLWGFLFNLKTMQCMNWIFHQNYSLTLSILITYSFFEFWEIWIDSVTCKGSDYLFALHSGSDLRSSRPQIAQCASIYTKLHNYNGLNVGGHRQPEASLTHSCVTVRSTANLSRGILLTRSCMTNRSVACLTRGCPDPTCRSEAYFEHLLCDRPLRG